MKPKDILWLIVGLIAAIIVVVSLFKPSGGGIENVDAAGAQKAIDAGAQVIDVRTPGEYQLGHLPRAINVPLDQLESQAASWDKGQTYLVYCATGARSTTAVNLMTGMGFENIRHFNAGMQAWGGQVEKGATSSATTIQTSGKPVLLEFYTNS